MSRYRKVAAVAATAGVLCLVALLVAFQADIRIAYHRQRMVSALNKAVELGARSPKQNNFINAYDRHKASLVKLGYFERREFPLQHVSVPSLQSRRLWEELLATFPDHMHFEMFGYEPTTRDMIVVWDRPQKLAAWEAIIKAHDRPVNVQYLTVSPPCLGITLLSLSVSCWLSTLPLSYSRDDRQAKRIPQT